MRFFLKLYLGLFLSVLSVSNALARGSKPPPAAGRPTPEATESLLNYFKSSCPSSYDSWTARAIADADALISVLQKAKQDPACASLSGTLGRLNLMSEQLTRYQNQDNSKNDLALGYQRKREELLLQLTASQDRGELDLVTVIQGELRSLQLQMSELQGQMESSDDYNDKLQFGRALHNFVISADTIMKQAGQSGACLEKNSDILPAVASVAAAAASAFLPTSYAFVAQAGSELISSVIEYVRVRKLDKQIASFDITKLEVAMQCGLESMSEQWCAADDGVRLATLTQKFLIDRPNPGGDLWKAIQIYQRDIPVLQRFLDSVQAGAIPTNTASNARREEVLARVEFVRNFESYSLALIAQNERLFEGAGSGSDETSRVLEQWAIEKSVIRRIVEKGLGISERGPGISDSPISKVISSRYMPFYLAGHFEEDIPTFDNIPGGSYSVQFDNLNPTKKPSLWPTIGAPVSLEVVKSRLLSLVALARDIVLKERSELVNVDPLLVATGYRTRDRRLTALTPEGALRNIINFVQTRIASRGGRDFLLEDTQALLEGIDVSMKRVFLSDDRSTAKLAASTAIDLVTRDLKLAEGFDFFEKRLETAAEDALLDLVVENSNDPNRTGETNDVARFLATNDILDQLRGQTAAPSLPELKLRLGHAKSVTQTTLRNFTALFAPAMRNVVDYLNMNARRDARSGTEYWDSPYGQQHAQLCFRLLDVDDVPRALRERKSLCEGARLISGYEGLAGAPAALRFIPNSFDMPHARRACVLRNYKRKVRIFESRIESGPATRR